MKEPEQCDTIEWTFHPHFIFRMILRIIIGIALAGAGVFIVLRTSAIVDFFGTVDWAEMKLGGGGTHLFYKLLGCFIIIVGFIVATNLWNAFLEATLGSFVPTGR